MASFFHTRKSALDRAHGRLVARVAAAMAPRIIGKADAADIANRADHMAAVHAAVIAYIEDVLADTVDRLSFDGGRRHDVEVILWDSLNGHAGDVVGQLAGAGVRFSQHQAAA